MRIIEKLVEFALIIIVFFSFIYILSFQHGHLVIEIIGYLYWINNHFFFICFLASVVGFFSFPLWDVGKYLNTEDVKEIARFQRKQKITFGMLAMAFFGLMGLLSEPNSFMWWVGLFILFCFFSWLIFHW